MERCLESVLRKEESEEISENENQFLSCVPGLSSGHRVHSAAGKSPASGFSEVSVHDPSVIKTGDTYYVFGSHLASAKSKNLMQWQQMSSSVNPNNPLIPNVYTELKETFDWAQSDTLWAPDVAQLSDGKYYMYYNACKGDSPRSALGVAVSDKIEGPYKTKASFEIGHGRKKRRRHDV